VKWMDGWWFTEQAVRVFGSCEIVDVESWYA